MPQVAAGGNSVYVVWRDNTPGNNEILFRASTDMGNTFGPTVKLSNNPGSSDQPQIATDQSGSDVYVAWVDDTPGNKQIFFAASTNNGASFGPVINLSNDAGLAGSPRMAALDSYVYVVWQDTTPGNPEILFAASSNNGATFGTPSNLSNDLGASKLPALAVSGSAVYVAWVDDTAGNNEIFFRASTNHGSTFGPVQNLSNDAGRSGGFGGLYGPALTASSANSEVYVAWVDDTPGNEEIFFTASIDYGTTFSPTVNLSNDAGVSDQPQVSTGPTGDDVYVAWRDNSLGNNEIFFRASVSRGSSFSATINLSSDIGNSLFQDFPVVQLASFENTVDIVWRDNSNLLTFDIFFRDSLNAGATLSSTVDISQSPAYTSGLQMVANGPCATNVYVVWREETVNYDEVFFIVGTTGSGNPCLITPRTMGYYKNHIGVTQLLLPILLGNYLVDTTTKASAIFAAANAKNAYEMLAAQLLTAKLNAATGAQASCVISAISQADAALAAAGYMGPGTTTPPSGSSKDTITALITSLDNFNNSGC